MKFLSKISIFLITAAIFMSALVVFVGAEDNDSPAWPYLRFTLEISEQNRLTNDNDTESFVSKVRDAASIPFFALARDYPDVTMWILGNQAAGKLDPDKDQPTLMSIDHTMLGFETYGDPSGMYKQLRSVIDSFTPTGNTMYEKLVSIHDYICKMNTYVMGAPRCYSAYGALVDRRSVCEGYAEAFKLLCDKAKIQCVLVAGMAHADSNKEREAHMWAYVRMDDGKWYAVDVTWNDAGDRAGNYDYFLIGSDTVNRGLKFSESHLVSHDWENIDNIDGKTVEGFEYPELSKTAYTTGNSGDSYVYGKDDNRYYYKSLSALQKELYDDMLAAILQNMPSDPNKTPTPPSTDDMVAPPPESTTDPNVTDPDETTTVTETTTEPDETTTVQETTTVDTTTELETTIADTTVPSDTTVIPQDTTTQTTTEPPVSTKPSTTNPPASSKNEETDPPVVDTTETVDTTVTDTMSDTTHTPDTTVNITTENQSKNDQNREMQKLYKAVTTIIIISAITGLSSVLVIFVVRYAKKHKN